MTTTARAEPELVIPPADDPLVTTIRTYIRHGLLVEETTMPPELLAKFAPRPRLVSNHE